MPNSTLLCSFLEITKDKVIDGDDAYRKNIFDKFLFSDEIDNESSKVLYIFSKVFLPKFSRKEIESKIRGIYNYSEEHSAKMLRYLEFLELAYSGRIDFTM